MLGTRGIPARAGGVETAVEELSVRLAARGHDVTVYCRSAYIAECETFKGVRLRHVPTIYTKHLEAIVHSLCSAVDATFRGYDIVHYHATGPSLVAPISRVAGQRVVATIQGLDYARAKWGRFARIVLRVAAWTGARVPHQTIVVSRDLQRHLKDRYGRETIYIPNGVPVPLSRGESNGEAGSYLLYLGRLVPEKRVHDLLEAYAQVSGDLPLIIAGGSSYSDDYVAKLKSLGGRDSRVSFLGSIFGDAKDELLANCLLFCQPSELEGLPIALLEAMSFGRCPVVSDLEVHREVVGAAGEPAAYVFRCGDVPGLRATLEEALSHVDDVRRRGATARAIVSRYYDWDAIASEHERLYANLLQR
jgi:glycosyltransferase involved in cell wall biosynthesis